MASKVQADQPSLSKTKLKDQLVAVFKGVLRSDHSQTVASFISENLLPGAYQADVATAISEMLPRPASAAPASKKVVLVQPLCWHCRRRGHKRNECPHIDKCKACLKYRNLKTGHFLNRPDNVCKKEQCLKHSGMLNRKNYPPISVDDSLQVNMINSEIKYDNKHTRLEPSDSQFHVIREFTTRYSRYTLKEFDYEYALYKDCYEFAPEAALLGPGQPNYPPYFEYTNILKIRAKIFYLLMQPKERCPFSNITVYQQFCDLLETIQYDRDMGSGHGYF